MPVLRESDPPITPRLAQGGTANGAAFADLRCKNVPPSHPGQHNPYPDGAPVRWRCAMLYLPYRQVKVGWDWWDEPGSHLFCRQMCVTPSPRLRWDGVGQVVQIDANEEDGN